MSDKAAPTDRSQRQVEPGVRVGHEPKHFFASSFFRVDDGQVIGIDEYWATVESPPAWRTGQDLAGLSRFEPMHDQGLCHRDTTAD